MFGFTFDVIHLMSFDKYIITCMYYHTIIQDSFTVLNMLCALPTYTPPSLTTGNH